MSNVVYTQAALRTRVCTRYRAQLVSQSTVSPLLCFPPAIAPRPPAHPLFVLRLLALSRVGAVGRDAIALFKRALAQNVEVKDRPRDARLYRALEDGHRRMVDEVRQRKCVYFGIMWSCSFKFSTAPSDMVERLVEWPNALKFSVYHHP